jgi:ABC-2 type transport system permease protein
MEFRLLIRNGEQLLINLIIPLLLLVMGRASTDIVNLGTGRPIDIVTPGVLTLAVLSASFTSLAISTGFERRYGLLKRLGASPLPRSGLLIGKLGAVLLIEVVQLTLLSCVALALGWHPSGGVAAVGWAALLVILGTAAFASLGLLIAGTLRAEATLAVANLVYVLLLVGGAVMVPLSRYPAAMRGPMHILPSTSLSQGLRAALGGASPSLLVLAVLATWALGAGALAVRTFKWE